MNALYGVFFGTTPVLSSVLHCILCTAISALTLCMWNTQYETNSCKWQPARQCVHGQHTNVHKLTIHQHPVKTLMVVLLQDSLVVQGLTPVETVIVPWSWWRKSRSVWQTYFHTYCTLSSCHGEGEVIFWKNNLWQR